VVEVYVRVNVTVQRQVDAVQSQLIEQLGCLVLTREPSMSRSTRIERRYMHADDMRLRAALIEPMPQPIVNHGVERGAGRIEHRETHAERHEAVIASPK